MSPLSATTDGRSQGFVNECLFVVHSPDTDTEIVTDGFVTHFLLTCTACYSLIQLFVAYILQNTNLHQYKNVWTDANTSTLYLDHKSSAQILDHLSK